MRGDSCPHCRSDARVCKNCVFYDVAAYNECREISADRVVDKEKANFCDFFSPRVGLKKNDKKIDLRSKADALFKKSDK